MNNTIASDGVFGTQKINGFGYGIAVSVGILFIITTILLASYFCNHSRSTPPAPRELDDEPDDHSIVAIETAGLDEATLRSYPKLLYSQAKFRNKDTTASCCSICLADYKDTDVLRSLPDCTHLFHRQCVDAWLRLHPSCPICRTSPLPTPLPTPLSEVVPLASQLRN